MTRKILRPWQHGMFCICILVFALTGYANGAVAADYPTKPIRLVVPYGAGGSTDLAARTLAGVLPKYLGQPVVVVNVPGAGGAVGASQTLAGRPDGYTLLMAAIGANVLRPALTPGLPYSYDSARYIARTQINPNILVVAKGSPYQDFGDLVTALRAGKKHFTYGTAGPGNVTHLGPNMLLQALGLPTSRATAVHYDSDAAAQLALLQGEVDFVQGNLASFSAALDNNALRGLAITTDKRLPEFDDVPTYRELGYPAVSIVGWRGVVGPKDLPASVVKTLQQAIRKATQDPAWLKKITALGDTPGYMNSRAFTAFVTADYKRYKKLATDIGLRPAE